MIDLSTLDRILLIAIALTVIVGGWGMFLPPRRQTRTLTTRIAAAVPRLTPAERIEAMRLLSEATEGAGSVFAEFVMSVEEATAGFRSFIAAWESDDWRGGESE